MTYEVMPTVSGCRAGSVMSVERHDVLVPRRDEDEDHAVTMAGQRERQHDLNEDSESPAAVDGGGFLDLAA